MKHINQFYSTYQNERDKHEFDIKELGEKIYYPGISAGDRRGNVYRYGAGYQDTKSDHYDAEFVRELQKIHPIYKVEKYLDYHYANCADSKKDDFTKHIKYTILPRLEKHASYQVATDWVNQKLHVNNTPMSSMNIKVGDHANVQVQQNTNNSNQTQQIENVSSAGLNQFIKDIRDNIESLKVHLTPKEIETLSEDVEYIARHQDNTSKKDILNSMWGGVKDILKAIPSNVIANVLTNPQILHQVITMM